MAGTKIANRPILHGLGLNARKVQNGQGFMLYLIDAVKNHSKFYEGLMLPNDDGTWKVLLRWGALTDSTATGKIWGEKYDAQNSHLDERKAKAVLSAKYRQKAGKGYVDAWKHKLPKGQYPVGLTRSVGFGHGTQSAAFCIPALRTIRDHLADAKSSLQAEQYGDADMQQTAAAGLAQTKLRGVDSSMSKKILDNLKHMQGRAVSVMEEDYEDPRAVRTWGVALSRLISYIDKQLSVCHGKMAQGEDDADEDGGRYASQRSFTFVKQAAYGQRVLDVVGQLYNSDVKMYGDPPRQHGIWGVRRSRITRRMVALLLRQGLVESVSPGADDDNIRLTDLGAKVAKQAIAIYQKQNQVWDKRDEANRMANFNPTDIGKVKPPKGDPDEMKIVKDTDQRWFGEVEGLYPSGGKVWDGNGKVPEGHVRRLTARVLTDRLARRWIAANDE